MCRIKRGSLERVRRWQSKQPSCIGRRLIGKLKRRKSYDLRQELSGPCQVGRLIRTSSNRLWAEVGAIGLDQQMIQGNPASDGAESVQSFYSKT